MYRLANFESGQPIFGLLPKISIFMIMIISYVSLWLQLCVSPESSLCIDNVHLVLVQLFASATFLNCHRITNRCPFLSKLGGLTSVFGAGSVSLMDCVTSIKVFNECRCWPSTGFKCWHDFQCQTHGQFLASLLCLCM